MAGAATTPARGRLLVAPQFRWLAALLIAAGATVTAMLGLHYSNDSQAGRIDVALGNRIAGHFGAHRDTLVQLVHVGDPATIALLSVVLATVLAFAGWWRAVAFTLLAPLLAGMLTDLVLKPLVDRRIGADAALAFPSGHTTGAVAVALVVAVVLLDPYRPPLRRAVQAVLAVLALGVAAGVAVALVALRYHYATDVIGGVGVALAVVLLVALALDGLAAVAERATSSGRRGRPAPRPDRVRQHS